MRKQERPIAERDLNRSLRDCYRIEDALWGRLRQLGCDWDTSAAGLGAALQTARAACPEWCEQAAWDAIAGSFARWAGIFGNLRLFVALRRKRDE